MARVKRGTIKNKARNSLLKLTKGFRWSRKNKEATAWTAMAHAGAHAFRDRRKKKSDFRRLWTIKINAEARKNGISYNKLIAGLKQKQVGLDRKALAEIAEFQPETFKRIADFIQK